MNDDQEINNLKKLFSDDKPTELQKHNWKVALRSKQQSHKKYFFWTTAKTLPARDHQHHEHKLSANPSSIVFNVLSMRIPREALRRTASPFLR